MSKNINVNPGQYKVAGRERPGEDLPEPERSPGLNKPRNGRSPLSRASRRRQPKKNR